MAQTAPFTRVQNASSALSCLLGLLAQAGDEQLNLVRAEELYSLLDMIHTDLAEGISGLIAEADLAARRRA